MATKKQGTDLGTLQENVEAATSLLKKANTELKRAKILQYNAEQTYQQAVASLEAGYDTVRAGAKVPA